MERLIKPLRSKIANGIDFASGKTRSDIRRARERD